MTPDPAVTDEAVQAVYAALIKSIHDNPAVGYDVMARAALEAAAPLLAAQVRRQTAEEIAKAIEDDDSNSDLGNRTRAWAARLARQIGEADVR